MTDTAFDREPVLILLGGAAVLVSAGLAAANLLHWVDLSGEQITAIVAFVATFAGLLGAAIRGQVYSPATHAAAVDGLLSVSTPLPSRVPGATLFDEDDAGGAP